MFKLDSVTCAQKQHQLRQTQQQLSMFLHMQDFTLLIKVNCTTTRNLDRCFAHGEACIAECTLIKNTLLWVKNEFCLYD